VFEIGAQVLDGGIAMRKILCTLLLAVGLFLCSGCKLLENMVSDVQGWNMSACVNGIDVCWQLFWDNSEKFEDGFVDAMEGL
jgi:hypothetical protein